MLYYCIYYITVDCDEVDMKIEGVSEEDAEGRSEWRRRMFTGDPT